MKFCLVLASSSSFSRSESTSRRSVKGARVRVLREGGNGRGEGHEIIADERKQAAEINLPISAACC